MLTFQAENALPTCQVYIRGELAGNFIRIHEEFGGEYDADEFCQFLRRNGISITLESD